MSGSAVRRVGGGRHRLLPPWAPIPLLGLLAGIFYLVFPGEKLAERMVDNVPDQTSVAYLRARTSHLEATSMTPVGERLVLADQQVQLGRLDDALDTLSPLVGMGDRQAHWQTMEVYRQRFFAEQDAAERRHLRDELLAAIRFHLDKKPPVSELERLATWAVELGAHRLAADIYDRLIDLSSEPSAVWVGLMLAATQLNELAPADPVSYALRAIDALLAGDEGAEALQRVDRYIKRFPGRRELLRKGIAVARAQGKATKAREWARSLIQLEGETVANLEQQIELALADGDALDARLWGRKLLALRLADSDQTVGDETAVNHQLQLEIGANDTAAARDLGRRLLAEAPDDPRLIRRQIDLELAHGDARAARDFGNRLLQQSPDDPAAVRQQLALEEGAGDAFRARDLGRKLMALATPDSDAIRDQMRRELAVGDPKAASQLGRDYLKLNPGDVAALRKQLELELAVGESDRARDLGRQLQTLRPADIDTLSRQVDLEMAAADLAGALNAAERLARISPDDVRAQQQLARLYQWNGMPREALQQWLLIDAKWPDPDQRRNTISLAAQLYDLQVVSRLLTESAADNRLSDKELDQWMDAVEGLGEPRQAIDLLEDYLIRQPRHQAAWMRLVDLWESLGDLTAAASAWDRMARSFTPDLAGVVRRANLAWLRFELEDALGVLDRYQSIAGNDLGYWRMRARLAWSSGDETLALGAYSKLAALGEGDAVTVERLSQLIRVRGDGATRQRLALEAWSNSRLPGFWLMAMDAATSQRDWQTAKALLNELGDDRQRLQSNARYWQFRALLAEQERDFKAARSHYQQVMRLSPSDRYAVAGFMWLLINARDLPALRETIAQWQPQAVDNQALWAPMAAGLRLLDRNRESIPWFRREAERNPADMNWLLSYADALNAAGYGKQSWHLRRHVLRKHRARVLDLLATRSPFDPGPLRRMAELIRDQMGDEAGQRLVNTMLARANDDALLHEFQIAWALAANQHGQARRWAFRAHLERLQLPGWQRLALALADNDLPKVDHLLATDPDLQASDRVEALRRLGRDDEALRTARAAMVGGIDDSTQRALALQARELLPRLPHGWALSYEDDDRGALSLGKTLAKVAWTRDQNTWQLDLGQYRLDANPANLILDAVGNEKQTMLTWRRRYRRAEAHVQMGAHLRMDKDVISFSTGYQRRLNDWIGGSLELALDEPGDESAGFRIAGLRDRLTLGLNAEISPREFIQGDVSLRNYESRHGSDLGDGVAANVALGHRIWLRNPEWRVGLNASWSRSRFPTVLPADIQGLFPAGTGPDALLSSRSREIGITTAFEKGIQRAIGNTGSSPRYLLELGSAWADPDWVQGFRMRLGISSRLLGRDDLSLWADFAQGTGGVDADDSLRLGAQYSRSFE